MYPIKVPTVSTTNTWTICSAVPSGVILCCATWDGTMRHCKAVLQYTPYRHPVATAGKAVGVCPGVKHDGVRPSIKRLPNLEVGGRGL